MVNLRNLTRLRINIAAVVLILAASGCSLFTNPNPPANTPVALPVESPIPSFISTLPPASPTPAEPTAAPEQPAEAQPTAGEPATAPPALASPTPGPTQAGAAFEGAPCDGDECQSSGSFFLKRPVGAGGRNTIVTSSRFGEYSRSLKSGNPGVFFLNSTGTPVVAAADGVVVAAGNDLTTSYGPYLNHYGNLVILKHQLPGLSEPVFTLYGHLSEILVKESDTVSAGQEIGKTGSSGDVRGSTLAFEVRMGENGFANVRNPELWLEPSTGEDGALEGTLAGRILDSNGNLVGASLSVEQLAGPGLPAAKTYYLRTYSDKKLSGQGPWGENFAAGDLPAGQYQISFWLKGLHQRVVEILPGKLTLVTFRID